VSPYPGKKLLLVVSPFHAAFSHTLINVRVSVFSLVGVVLIAHPQALFGTDTAEGIPESISDVGEAVISTTSSQRLIAVG
jgi:hypothetical protein